MLESHPRKVCFLGKFVLATRLIGSGLAPFGQCHSARAYSFYPRGRACGAAFGGVFNLNMNYNAFVLNV